MVIFDCNGVLVDSEPIAAAVAAEEFTRAGFPLTAEIIAAISPGAAAPTCWPRWK
jgi:beta-phosphoglucomutase-like phosphatase (HAD superfamily)